MSLIAVALAAASSATGGGDATCRVPDGARVLARSASAVVYRRRARESPAVGCLRSDGSRVRIDRPAEGSVADGPFAFAGRFVVFGAQLTTLDDPMEDFTQQAVSVVSLSDDPASVRVARGSQVGRGRPRSAFVARVAVRRDGAFAWIDCTSSRATCRDRRRRRVVTNVKARAEDRVGQVTVVATGAAIRTDTLRFRGDRVCWRASGTSRCAAVPPSAGG